MRDPVHHPASECPGVGRRCTDRLEHVAEVVAPHARKPERCRAPKGPRRQTEGNRTAHQASAAVGGRNHTCTEPRCCATPCPTAPGILTLGTAAVGPSVGVVPLLRAGTPRGPLRTEQGLESLPLVLDFLLAHVKCRRIIRIGFGAVLIVAPRVRHTARDDTRRSAPPIALVAQAAARAQPRAATDPGTLGDFPEQPPIVERSKRTCKSNRAAAAIFAPRVQWVADPVSQSP